MGSALDAVAAHRLVHRPRGDVELVGDVDRAAGSILRREPLGILKSARSGRPPVPISGKPIDAVANQGASDGRARHAESTGDLIEGCCPVRSLQRRRILQHGYDASRWSHGPVLADTRTASRRRKFSRIIEL